MDNTEMGSVRRNYREQHSRSDRTALGLGVMTGPVDERRHFPRQRKGCYYERVEDCCWLCVVRFTVAGARSGPERAERESEHETRRSSGTLVRDGGE